MRRDPAGILECLGGRRYRWFLGVGPWQYQCSTGWVLGGWEGGSTHPVHPPTRTGPVQQPATAPAHVAIAVDVGSMLNSSSDSPKEILGVDNALYTGARRVLCLPLAATLRTLLFGPSPGA